MTKTVKNYAIGQKPDDARTIRYLIEMPVGGLPLGVKFAGESLAVSALVPTTGPHVIHPLVCVPDGVPIDLLIGESLGDLIDTVFIPDARGAPSALHVFKLEPWPTSSILKPN